MKVEVTHPDMSYTTAISLIGTVATSSEYIEKYSTGSQDQQVGWMGQMKVEVTDMSYTTAISLIGGVAATQIVLRRSFLPFQPPLSPLLLHPIHIYEHSLSK